MKYKDKIDQIRAKRYSRADLAKMRVNAEAKLKAGDIEAQAVIDAIDQAEPADKEFVFMGFCPGATMENRMDIEWKAAGTCTFVSSRHEQQAERFNVIAPGDRIILKKRQEFGKTMQLYGYGRVKSIQWDEQGHRYLVMDWSAQDEIIEVPLMGCNSTVDVRSLEQVEGDMPQRFWNWLGA